VVAREPCLSQFVSDLVNAGERLGGLLQVLVARVDIGLHGERGVVVPPADLLTMEIGTPAFSIRDRVVCRESCSLILRRPSLASTGSTSGNGRDTQLCARSASS
jgi:hypothetical protein